MTPRIASMLEELRTPTNQVCFLVTTGYFKATKRFFGRRFRDHDIEYVARKLGFLPKLIDPEAYEETTYRRHQQFVRDLLGFERWDDNSKRLVTDEIRDMVRSQARAKFIFRHVIDILEHRHIEIPTSRALTELILDEIKRHKCELTATIDEHLSQTTRDFLDRLLEAPNDDETEEGRLQTSKLALLKRISQSTKPSKIKGTVDDFRTIRDLYRDIDPVINLLDLTPAGIRFYAQAVMKSKVFQVSQRTGRRRQGPTNPRRVVGGEGKARIRHGESRCSAGATRTARGGRRILPGFGIEIPQATESRFGNRQGGRIPRQRRFLDASNRPLQGKGWSNRSVGSRGIP